MGNNQRMRALCAQRADTSRRRGRSANARFLFCLESCAGSCAYFIFHVFWVVVKRSWTQTTTAMQHCLRCSDALLALRRWTNDDCQECTAPNDCKKKKKAKKCEQVLVTSTVVGGKTSRNSSACKGGEQSVSARVRVCVEGVRAGGRRGSCINVTTIATCCNKQHLPYTRGPSQNKRVRPTTHNKEEAHMQSDAP